MSFAFIWDGRFYLRPMRPSGREGLFREARLRPGQIVVPGGRPRMTAGDLSAQSLVVPPGRALPMATAKPSASHFMMGMGWGPELVFGCLTCERERFMLIGCMSECFGSREAPASSQLANGGCRGDRGQARRY